MQMIACLTFNGQCEAAFDGGGEANLGGYKLLVFCQNTGN